MVKAGPGAGGACALCRVVLPDGATSVVGVEAALSVRRLVDRLLTRRNLLCAHYDVLLKDNDQVILPPQSRSDCINDLSRDRRWTFLTPSDSHSPDTINGDVTVVP